MKKYLILTSVMTLVACGGGSGGHRTDVGDGVRGTTDDTVPYKIATIETRDSNAEITPLVSEIDICSNCTSPRASSSRKSTQTIGDQTFTIYDLTDVDFVMADEGFDGKMQFNVDNTKKITGVTMLKDPEDDEDEDKTFTRQPDNTFNGQVTIEGGQHVDGKLTYRSVANEKNNGLGLRYSDFGIVRVDSYNDETRQFEELQHFTFIGGYDTAKRINENTIDSKKTFAGYAVGSVMAVRNGEGSGDEITVEAPATLTFNDGTSTMTASFNNWYDITHTKSSDDESITFANYKNRKDDFRMVSNNTDEKFTLRNHEYQEYEAGMPMVDANSNPVMADTLNSDIRYYGDNGQASEVVGLVQIRDRGTEAANYNNINDYGDEHAPRQEVRMNISFGGKSKQ